MSAPDEGVRLVGRSSSHFTRVAAIFAHELEVPVVRVVVGDLMALDAAAYGANPALKLPTLRTATSTVFGTENICRKLAELAPRSRRIVWPEQVVDDLGRNAQELVWHGMAAQVQLVLGTLVAGLPPDNVYFAKSRLGLDGALRWLDEHLDRAVAGLDPARELSLLEVTLFCLVEHLSFRPTVSTAPYPALVRFAARFGERPSAQCTRYRMNAPSA
ncbi:MAG: hypothetical protein JWM10_4263 [Myxococcaceae bacterium]|nr:hypothetical protein [Myxococcaceae bacterium]